MSRLGVTCLSCFLLMIYVLSILRIYAPALDYAINKDFIASTLCENKDNPSIQCEGKCFLKKETGKIAQEESKTSVKSNLMKVEEIPAKDFSLVPEVYCDLLLATVPLYKGLYNYQYSEKILNPPQV